VEGRTGAVLKAAAIAFVAWLAIDRFVPAVPLSFLSSDAGPADVPDHAARRVRRRRARRCDRAL